MVYKIVMESPQQKKLRYSNIGLVMATVEMNLNFARRLKVVDFFKKRPEMSLIPTRCPIFVTGLPRTGTTFLHRLLSLDPQYRAPLLWELINPVPLSTEPASADDLAADREKRRKFFKKVLKERDMLGDNSLKHIHEIGADLPEECLVALTGEMPINLSQLYTLYMLYEEWGDKFSDKMTKAYGGYRDILRLLSYQVNEAKNPKSWLLKCPIHLFFFKQLGAIFPDAKIVWTHRHPVSAVPSPCSLLKGCHQTYYWKESRRDAQMGDTVARVTESLLPRAEADLLESKLDHTHVLYNNLIKDPIGTVRGIYESFGWEVSQQFEKNLHEYIQQNRAERAALKAKMTNSGQALHTYYPEEFGLTEGRLSSGAFQQYADKFKLPMSKN